MQGIATHDANGNMTVMPNLKAKYDAWNRLVELRDASDNLVARYEYNGLGHRITKKTYSPTETRYYFYNENWQCLEERVDNSVDRTYVWGEKGIDDMVCRERGNERLYPLTDPNGNVVAIADVSGDVKERYRYDAFGKVTLLNPDFTTKVASDFDWDYLYTSRPLDKESGLQHSRFRYYHPELGRFINRDPLDYDAEDVNLYRYVFNKPIDGVDPFGLDWFLSDWWNPYGTLIDSARLDGQRIDNQRHNPNQCNAIGGRGTSPETIDGLRTLAQTGVEVNVVWMTGGLGALRTLQTTGHTLNNSTLRALGLTAK